MLFRPRQHRLPGQRHGQQNGAQAQTPSAGGGSLKAGFQARQRLGLLAVEPALLLAVGKGLMREHRQLRNLMRQFRRVLLQCLPEALGPGALAHPALEIGLGRAPQVQIGIELATQAFDVEQGFLQEYQLWLDFHVEAPRGLKQPQQHLTERDVFERLLQNRLANRADRRSELVGPRAFADPAGFDMQHRDFVIVLAEEREQVPRQVVLVFPGQAADDAAVDGDVTGFGGVVPRDEDIAGMHVGMEEIVAEDLGEEYLHTTLGQLLEIGALGAQGIDIRHRNAVDALLDHDLTMGQRPVNGGHVEQRRALEVALELRGVGSFLVEIELVEQRRFVVLHHFHRAEATRFGDPAHQAREGVQQADILAHDAIDTGANDLDHDLLAAVQLGGVNLGDRRRGHRLGLERRERFLDRLAQLDLDHGAGGLAGEGGDLILQPFEFIGDIRRQQIAARRQHLAELDEDRSQRFQRQT